MPSGSYTHLSRCTRSTLQNHNCHQHGIKSINHWSTFIGSFTMLIAKFASPAQHAQQGHKQLKTDLPLILAKLVNLLYSIIWRFHSKHMNK